MHDEMEKRVADAMIARWRVYALPGYSPDIPYWREMARAAIEAMREPTSAMVIAGLECEHIDLASEWRAMIDHALSYPGITGAEENPAKHGIL